MTFDPNAARRDLKLFDEQCQEEGYLADQMMRCIEHLRAACVPRFCKQPEPPRWCCFPICQCAASAKPDGVEEMREKIAKARRIEIGRHDGEHSEHRKYFGCAICDSLDFATTLLDEREQREKDWTVSEGRTNTSPAFEELVTAVERLIRNGAHSLIAGDADSVARVIVAQLAHVHGLQPREVPS